MARTLILGGARSGKSRLAQTLAEKTAKERARKPVMIVTAEALDAEMSDRIARHRNDRGRAWRVVEAPLALVQAIDDLSAQDVAVVDCLTLWLSNLLMRDAALEAAGAALMESLIRSPAEIILVSNEVGFGIVPDNALARRFRDEAGRLHQTIAATAETVLLVVAGQKLVLKSP
jgi:adenosylcobinamide kinase/adenosylcobinamide-phosphate guanylyltransferase